MGYYSLSSDYTLRRMNTYTIWEWMALGEIAVETYHTEIPHYTVEILDTRSQFARGWARD